MSDTSYVVLGWRAGSADPVALTVGQVLNIEFELRDSLYHGDYCLWRGPGDSELMIQDNFVEEDDGLRTDDRFPEHEVLLYGKNVPRPMLETIAGMDGAELLEER